MNDVFSKTNQNANFSSPCLRLKIASYFPPILRKYIQGNALSCFVKPTAQAEYTESTSGQLITGIGSALQNFDSFTQQPRKPYWAGLLIVGFGAGIFGAHPIFLLFALLACIQAFASRNASTVYIQYLLNAESLGRYRKFCKEFTTLNSSQYVWVQSVNAVGAKGRAVAKIGYGLPKGLRANTRFPCLKTSNFTYYFAPDGIIIQIGNRTLAHGYPSFTYQVVSTPIHEVEFSPKDASAVAKRPKHSSAEGKPDKRYKINPMMPVNQYPVLQVFGGAMGFNVIASNPRGLNGLQPSLLLAPAPEKATQAPQKPAVDNKLSANVKVESSLPLVPPKSNPAVAPQTSQKPFSEKIDEDLFEIELGDEDSNDFGFTIKASLGGRSYSIPLPTTDLIEEGRLFSRYWKGKGQPIVVQGVTISGGFVYFSNQRLAEATVSQIEQGLYISEKPCDYRRNLHGYWPTYRGITPEERRAYIDFLASDRSDPTAGIGLVFLYFYGLERRLVIDSNFDSNVAEERDDLIREVKRLLVVYGANNSFKRYANRLIEYAETSHKVQDNFSEKLFAEAFPKFGTGAVNSKIPKLSVSIAIAQHVSRGGIIDVDWAYLWAQQYTESLDKTVVSYKPLFYKAFCTAFNNRYPEGVPMQETKTPLTDRYNGAASDVSHFDFPIGDLMDVAGANANVHRIRELIADVYALTEPYWRIKRKTGSTAFTIDPFLYLPANLWPQKLLDITSKLSKWVNKDLSLADLAGAFDVVTISRQGLTRLYTRLAELGFYIEPNILQGAATPKVGDCIVLYTGEAGEHLKPLSAGFPTALVFLELACAVSVADGHASEDERSHIFNRIDNWPDLPEFEKSSLRAKAKLLFGQTITFAKLKTKLKVLPEIEIEHIAKTLVDVSGADRNLNPKEVALLEKIFSVLGIPDRLHDLLHSSTSGAGEKARQAKPVQVAPIENNTAQAGVSLDFDKIAQLQAETRHVADILSKVFDQDEPDEISQSAPQEVVPVKEQDAQFAAFPSLTTKQAEFLRVLLAQAEWSRADIAAEASRIGVMLDGTMEVLNELCWEVFDEALTDGDAVIEVDQSVVELIVTAQVEREIG